MVTSLDDLSVFQNNDRIAVSNCRKSVGDNKYGTAFHQVVHTLLNNVLCTGIDA